MAIFKSIDCVIVKVPDLAAGIHFYSETLGHELLWKTDVSAGLKLSASVTELVLHTKLNPETDFYVDDTSEAYKALLAAGAKSVREPFDVQIGKCAVVKDPWGNTLTIIDCTKGLLKTDRKKNVTGNIPAKQEENSRIPERDNSRCRKIIPHAVNKGKSCLKNT